MHIGNISSSVQLSRLRIIMILFLLIGVLGACVNESPTSGTPQTKGSTSRTPQTTKGPIQPDVVKKTVNYPNLTTTDWYRTQ